MSSRNDSAILDYAANIPVTNGVTWNGPLLTLNSAISVSWQIQLTNSAAGSYSINPTNVADVPGPVWYAGTQPQAQGAITGTISANANGSAVLYQDGGNRSAALAFGKVWLSFTPSASGNLYVVAYVRRYPN